MEDLIKYIKQISKDIRKIMCENEEARNPWNAKDYLEKWNAYAYLQFFNMEKNKAVHHLLHFLISNISKILDEKLKRKPEIILEYGGGPTLWPSFLLAQYADQIWFCDFTPSNLTAIEDWLNMKPNAFDWRPMFNYILETKQSHHNNINEYETKLRCVLQNGKIFRCDVNGEHSLFIDLPDNDKRQQQQFDMIFSSCCLESACSSYDIFKQTIRRFSNILKPDGILLLCSFRNSTSYEFDGHTYTDLPLNEEIIQTAFVQTGNLTEPVCITLETKPDPAHHVTHSGLMIHYSFRK